MIRFNFIKSSFICILSIAFCWQTALAQQKTITGTVRDTKGEGLPVVTILVKGTSLATMTEDDGSYSITVPADATTLIASFVGMKDSEQEINNKTVIDFTLESMSTELDEVVVIGYGRVKKRDLTGSVASVGGDAVRSVPVANVAEAVTGRLAGVQITTTEGSPDAEMKIRIRGGGSVTGDNSPLYIVDGFPVQSISDIPSSEIESIDVLKDASSTAIYGSRGANGVIIITTKGGKEGKFSVSYNAYYSIKKIANKLDVLPVKDYLKWQYEATLLKNTSSTIDLSPYEKYFGTYQDMDMYDNVTGNNWQDLVYGRVGHAFNHNLNITGGSDKITYAFNYANITDKAIMAGSNFKRDNLSLKLKHKPIKQLTFDYSARYSNTKVNGGGLNEQNEKSSSDSRLRHSVIYTPLPLKSIGTDNNDEEEATSEMVNPFIAIADSERKQTRRNLNLSGGVTWDIMKGLTFKSDVGIDRYDATDNRFYGKSTYYVRNTPSSDKQNMPAAILANTTRNTFRNTNTLNYDFAGILKSESHSLTVLLGQENLKTQTLVLTNTIHGFPESFTASDAFNLSTQGAAQSIENYSSPDDKLVSFFGRANYDFRGKYLVSATFRADGSSKFSRGNRWGYFPSAAVAWRISSESFMEGTKSWLQDLKLRFSYGTAGNNNIPSGQMIQSFESKSTTWLDGFSNYWSASKTMANPDLKWETTYTRNIGVDYTLWNGKINGSVELYLNNTKDLLIEFPIQGTGYDYQYRNMGETQNKGLELQLNYYAINTKNFGLNFGFNIGFNKNKIKDLGVMEDFGASSQWTSEIVDDYWISVGGSVGQMYGYKSAGRYELSDFEGYNGTEWVLKSTVPNASGILGTLRPGMMKLQDIVGNDGVVDAKDRTIIGDANPTHTGGLTINARLHNFDFSAAFNWSFGNDVYNANKIEYTSTSKYRYRSMTTEMADGKRWTNMTADGTITNDAAQLTALNEGTSMWSPYMRQFVLSDWAVEDGSFLRLNTVTLGYTLPVNLTQKLLIKNLRVYATVYNVFCLTNYSGFDPEVSTRRRTALTPGVDYSAYPKSRQYIFGVNLTF